MKVSMLSTRDIAGGAGRAAYRLHYGLQKLGVCSTMLVQNRTSTAHSIYGPTTPRQKLFAQINRYCDKLALKKYDCTQEAEFSAQWVPSYIFTKDLDLKTDLYNLHWINEGFVSIEALRKINKPIVWTFHDMWPFTGGCHYAGSCKEYANHCGQCPQLKSSKVRDLSHSVMRRKIKAWKSLKLTIVTPSRWLASAVKSSVLFSSAPIEVIPNGLDLSLYKPIDKLCARDVLSLPKDKKIILFCAVNATSAPRKGYDLLIKALDNFSSSEFSHVELLVAGATGEDYTGRPIPIKTHFLGGLSDDVSLSIAYAAADVFVTPSLEENLPNTVVEALACGTPCVAFSIGGLIDLIDHKINGYLAEPFSSKDLINGIQWVFQQNETKAKELSIMARKKAEAEFSLDLQSKRYYALFNEVLNNDRNNL